MVLLIIRFMKSIIDILITNLNSNQVSYKKGDFVQKAESKRSQSIYVKKGILRSYIIDSTGKEHIYMFAPEEYIIGDIEAMAYNHPAKLYIDCLEDSEVILFDKEKLTANLSKENLAVFNQLLSRRIGRLQRRVLMLMGAPAIDRYKYFLDVYPDLPNRLPQRMIASYLGIAPQTLSTIRRQISRSK